jgi:uncharacterized protein (DUF1800 family)
MTHATTSRLGIITVVAGLLSLYTGPVAAQRTKAALPPADTWSALHVLNRIAYGPRPGDIERVRKMGLSAYIEEQLHPEKIADAALDARLTEFQTLTLDTQTLAEKYFQPAEDLRRAQAATAPAMSDPAMAMTPPQPTAEQRQAQQLQQSVLADLMSAKIVRAVESNRQLEEVLTDFWFNHFNVYAQKGQVRQYLTEYERDAIRPHVLGTFRDLLGATAHSPAMLFYLDNWQSSAPNAEPILNQDMMRRLNDPRLPPGQRQQMQQRLEQARRQQPRGLNENYARELLELHTLGVDGGYTQQDVGEVARALTG